jgi:hypothetical protein
MDPIIMLLQRAAVSAADTAQDHSDWVTFAYWAAGGVGTGLIALGLSIRSAIVWIATNIWMPREKAQVSMLESIEDYMEVSKHAFPDLSGKIESVKLEIRESRAVCQKIQAEPLGPKKPTLRTGEAHA